MNVVSYLVAIARLIAYLISLLINVLDLETIFNSIVVENRIPLTV